MVRGIEAEFQPHQNLAQAQVYSTAPFIDQSVTSVHHLKKKTLKAAKAPLSSLNNGEIRNQILHVYSLWFRRKRSKPQFCNAIPILPVRDITIIGYKIHDIVPSGSHLHVLERSNSGQMSRSCTYPQKTCQLEPSPNSISTSMELRAVNPGP